MYYSRETNLKDGLGSRELGGIMFSRVSSIRMVTAAGAAAAASFHSRSPASLQESPSGSPRGSLVTDWSDPKKARRLERNYQNPEVVVQRKEMLSVLRPKPGEHVLDVGCGPGFMMQELWGVVGPSGRVEGVDPAPIMCDLARARLASANPVAVRVGGAEDLPYADESFDAVVLSQVLLYVHDVPRALSEAHRVLRPGGRVLICDTDWDSLVVNTSDKARLERIRQVCCTTFVDAHLPPKLPGMLTQAGFQISGVQTCPMAGAGEADRTGGSFVGNWAFRVAVEKATACGLSESDVKGWLAEQQALSEAGAFFVCLHRFFFLAHKPKQSEEPEPRGQLVSPDSSLQ